MDRRIIQLVVVILLALAGVYLALYLTDYHYKLEFKQDNEVVDTSLPCTISDSFNCDLVNSSEWSEIFGIPIAFLGFLFYEFVLAIALLALWRPDVALKPLIVVHALTIVGLGYSAFLFYIAEFVIGALCPYCLMMYAVNVGLAIMTYFVVGKSYKEMKEVMLK